MSVCASGCCRGGHCHCFSSPTSIGTPFAGQTSFTIIESKLCSSGQKNMLVITGGRINSRTERPHAGAGGVCGTLCAIRFIRRHFGRETAALGGLRSRGRCKFPIPPSRCSPSPVTPRKWLEGIPQNEIAHLDVGEESVRDADYNGHVITKVFPRCLSWTQELLSLQYAVNRGLVAGDRFRHCARARHEALPRVGC